MNKRRWMMTHQSFSFVRSFVRRWFPCSLARSFIHEPFTSMKALFYLIIWTLLTLPHTAYWLPSILSHSWYPFRSLENRETRAPYSRANQAINLISFRIANYFVLFDVWNCNAHKIKLHPLILSPFSAYIPLASLLFVNFHHFTCEILLFHAIGSIEFKQ